METTERPGSANELSQKIEEIDQLIQEIESILAEPKPEDLRAENENELITTQEQLERDKLSLVETLKRKAAVEGRVDDARARIEEVFAA